MSAWEKFVTDKLDEIETGCGCSTGKWTVDSCHLHPTQPFGSLLAETMATEKGRMGMALAEQELELREQIAREIEEEAANSVKPLYMMTPEEAIAFFAQIVRGEK